MTEPLVCLCFKTFSTLLELFDCLFTKHNMSETSCKRQAIKEAVDEIEKQKIAEI